MRTTYAKEAHVKDDVKALLSKFDWFYFMPPANAYGKSGISDFIAIKRGTFLAIETKFGTNKPTAMQIGFLNSIRSCDGFAFVVSDRNIAWLEAFLESFDESVAAESRGERPAPEHGARLINALAELSNKLLDTAAPPTTAVEVDPAVH